MTDGGTAPEVERLGSSNQDDGQLGGTTRGRSWAWRREGDAGWWDLGGVGLLAELDERYGRER